MSPALGKSERYKQIGITIFELGTLLAGIALIGGALIVSELEMRLRITLLAAGIVVIVVLFAIPLAVELIVPMT